jgi:hypothetical protein
MVRTGESERRDCGVGQVSKAHSIYGAVLLLNRTERKRKARSMTDLGERVNQLTEKVAYNVFVSGRMGVETASFKPVELVLVERMLRSKIRPLIKRDTKVYWNNECEMLPRSIMQLVRLATIAISMELMKHKTATTAEIVEYAKTSLQEEITEKEDAQLEQTVKTALTYMLANGLIVQDGENYSLKEIVNESTNANASTIAIAE